MTLWVPLEVPAGYESPEGYPPPECSKVDGLIQLRGLARADTVYQLPAGFRPKQDVGFIQSYPREGRIWATLTRISKDGSVIVEAETDMGPIPYDPASDPNLEPVTYGQGNFGYRCVTCGADDYNGAINHKGGCAEMQPRLRELRES